MVSCDDRNSAYHTSSMARFQCAITHQVAAHPHCAYAHCPNPAPDEPQLEAMIYLSRASAPQLDVTTSRHCGRTPQLRRHTSSVSPFFLFFFSGSALLLFLWAPAPDLRSSFHIYDLSFFFAACLS